MVSSEDERGDYVIPYVCFAIKPRCTEIIGTNVSGRLKYEDQPSSINKVAANMLKLRPQYSNPKSKTNE